MGKDLEKVYGDVHALQAATDKLLELLQRQKSGVAATGVLDRGWALARKCHAWSERIKVQLMSGHTCVDVKVLSNVLLAVLLAATHQAFRAGFGGRRDKQLHFGKTFGGQ